MISAQQKEALALLAEIWELSPDIRLGQLFAHLGFLGEIHLGRSLGYIDDDELLSVLSRHRAELRARLLAAPNQGLQPGGTPSPLSEISKPVETVPAAEH